MTRNPSHSLEQKAVELLNDRMFERLGRPLGDDLRVEVRIDPELPDHLGTEGFQLNAPPGGPAIVTAPCPQGLIYGAGRLLMESRFSEESWEVPEISLTSVPEKELRPIYFATHFGNWYCHAEIGDLRRYIEDLALSGYNALITWFDFHHFKSLDDGAEQWERLGELDALARDVGMRVGRIAIANESFADQAPPELRAIGRLEGTGYETDLCPSKPEARAIILEDRREFLERVRQTTSLEWLCLWPYDQGGCNCEQCTPWPETYMDLGREIAAMTAEVLPDTEIMVSAWWIGTHVSGEDEAFFECLERREEWFRTIVVGTVELRRWLADGRKVPDEYGLLLFPEISMFDALPWGSRGANPAPRKFAAEMDELGPSISGAMPYSEGRYEDINKFLWAQLQWDSRQDVTKILGDYGRYSFGVEETTSLLYSVEAGLKDLPSAPGRHDEALRLEKQMPDWGRHGWRWQILRAHTAIDALRWELEASDTSEERRQQVREELRAVYEHVQYELYLHDEKRSLLNWIYSPFDVWLTLPFNELVLPTGA